MKTIKYTFLLLFLTVSFISCSDDDSNNLDPNTASGLEFRQELNVSYGSDSDQVFDIYLPANRTLDTKVMILVHGGGWTSGDKSSMNLLKDLILQEIPNVAVVNINYRLADQNNPPFPMQIDDISEIISFLNDNQDDYVISNEFGFIGTSAGAHLSMLWSYAHDQNAVTKMVASIVGPTNFTDPAYLNNTNPEIEEIMNVIGIDASIEFLELVSPYHQVTSDAPPTILFYGGQDPLIPTSQGVDMQARLAALGVTHQFILYPNAGHGWIGPEFIDTWTNLKLFIDSHL